jgi:hypothetical protein
MPPFPYSDRRFHGIFIRDLMMLLCGLHHFLPRLRLRFRGYPFSHFGSYFVHFGLPLFSVGLRFDLHFSCLGQQEFQYLLPGFTFFSIGI